MKKLAIITGASSGIGKATALKLAENGYSLLLTARRQNLLLELERLILSIYERNFPNEDLRIKCISFDISKRKSVNEAFENLPDEFKKPDLLVNNAGLAAGFDSFESGSIDDWEAMIDTNIKGLLYVSRLIMPAMVERKTGHIVNIGSIAGKEVYAKGNVYCATKHAVDAITKAMRIDLLPYGVKVSSIQPGMVETEFSLVRFKGDSKRAKSVYDGLIPLSADDIAETVWFVISRPSHVNINDLLIMPTAQANSVVTHRQ